MSTPAPTLRAVARAAGVSAMTVSRVLRRQSGVSAALRGRVEAAAAALGYRPDPQVAKLMQHLRSRRGPGYRSTMVAVTDIPLAIEPPYVARLHAAAVARAEALGFGFEVLRVRAGAARSVARVVAARGCEAVLLLPTVAPVAWDDLLPWAELSTVAVAQSVTSPAFHRVLPHHPHNARELCARLVGAGMRRIGFVATATHGVRTGDAFNAVLALHHARACGADVPPLVYEGERPSPAVLEAWLKRVRPDAVVTHIERNVAVIAAAARRARVRVARIALTSLETLGGAQAGINEDQPRIGGAAVELLAAMVHRGERGVPEVALTTLVPGVWEASAAEAAAEA